MNKVYRGYLIGSATLKGLEIADDLYDDDVYYVAVNVQVWNCENVVDILSINGGENDAVTFTRTHVSPMECMSFYPVGGTYPWMCGEDVALFYTRDKALVESIEERMHKEAVRLGY